MIFAALGSGTPYSKDKEKGRKHMMISMGMSRFAYYAGNFLFNSIFVIGSSILWLALLFGINNRFVAYNDPAPLIFLVFFCVVLADLWSCTFAVLTPSFEAYSAFIFLILMTLFPVRLAIHRNLCTNDIWHSSNCGLTPSHYVYRCSCYFTIMTVFQIDAYLRMIPVKIPIIDALR